MKGNRKILASRGESESSILANLLRVLNKSSSFILKSYIGRNTGTTIDLDDFMCNIVIKYESLVKDGEWDTSPKNMLISLLSLDRLKNLISYSLNNQTLKKGTKPTMVVTKALTMVASHGKQYL